MEASMNLVRGETAVTLTDPFGNRFPGLHLHSATTRLRGWLGREATERQQALMLSPCNAVHFIGMRESLEVLFINKAGQVRKHYPRRRPFSIPVVDIGAWATIEIPSRFCPSEWAPESVTWQPLNIETVLAADSSFASHHA